MKTETVAKQDPLWSASVCLLSQRPISLLSKSGSEFISFLLLSIQIHLINSASPCFAEIVSVKLKSGLFNLKLRPQQ